MRELASAWPAASRSTSAAAAADADRDPRRWRMLGLLATAELLGMSLWFGASAVASQFTTRWHLSAGETAWLTTIVQLGFVAGTAMTAILNLADVLPSPALFGACALAGSAVNAVLVVAPTFSAALACRFFTGFFLAGVYPPAMKMIATWFRSRRGLAIGGIVGALTVGKATPYLVHALPGAGIRTVVLAASLAALAAAALTTVGYRDGPYPFAARPFDWRLVADVLQERNWRLATGGYLGHMFELYSFWTWVPSFLAASAAVSAHAHGAPRDASVSLLAFGTIAVGGFGCVWGGLWADRHGRPALVTLSLALSGSCAILSPLAFGSPLLLVGLLTWCWGFFVIADSAQFSALVTEAVAAHAVGTALTIQTSLGFLLTMVSIQIVPPTVAALGWRWAFPMLALGPAAGIMAIRRLASGRSSIRA